MNIQAKFINSVLIDARSKAQQRIAEAVDAALHEYHKQTGGHIVGITLEITTHRYNDFVNDVMLTNVSLDCALGGLETS